MDIEEARAHRDVGLLRFELAERKEIIDVIDVIGIIADASVFFHTEEIKRRAIQDHMHHVENQVDAGKSLISKEGLYFLLAWTSGAATYIHDDSGKSQMLSFVAGAVVVYIWRLMA